MDENPNPGVIYLSPEAYDMFVKTCENPPAPNPKLVELFKRHGYTFSLDPGHVSPSDGHPGATR